MIANKGPVLPLPRKEIKLPTLKDEDDEDNVRDSWQTVESKQEKPKEKKLDKARNNLIKLFDDPDDDEDDDLSGLRESTSRTNTNQRKTITLNDKMASMFNDKKDPLPTKNHTMTEQKPSSVLPIKPVLPEKLDKAEIKKPKIFDDEEEAPRLNDIKAKQIGLQVPVERKKIIVEPIDKRKSVTKPLFFEDDEEETTKKEPEKLSPIKEEHSKKRIPIKVPIVNNPIKENPIHPLTDFRKGSDMSNLGKPKDIIDVRKDSDMSNLGKPNDIIDIRKGSDILTHSLKASVAMFEKKEKSHDG